MSKVVLVTGSAKGIGAAIIEELAAAGYDCVINYHTSEKEAFALQENFQVQCPIPGHQMRRQQRRRCKQNGRFYRKGIGRSRYFG